MRQGFRARDDADRARTNALITEAYEDLRRRVRAMSSGAPPTLVGSAGLNEVLARFAKRGVRFESRPELVAACLWAVRRTWWNYRRARRRAEELDSAVSLAMLVVRDEEHGSAVRDDAIVLQDLLDKLRRDAHVADRRKIARTVELHDLCGMTQDETADALGVGRSTVQRRLAFFHAWARLVLAPELREVEALAAELELDAAVAARHRIAKAVRLLLVEGVPPEAAAASTRRSPAELDRDLRFFRAWAAARAMRGSGARAAAEAS